MKTIRDNIWLLARLDYLWDKHFPDVPQNNKVFIKFGRYSKLRLGSIKLDKKTGFTHITITSMFKKLRVPEAVVDHTIAHELVHYAHGFSSPHPRLHRYPHEGGVVKRELLDRGFGEVLKKYQAWIRVYRKELYNRFAKTPGFQTGDEGEARFQDSATLNGEALESLKYKKTADFQSAEAYERN